MQAANNQEGKANLISSDLGNSAVISPVEGAVDYDDFQNNTWGYSLDGNKYQAVPVTTGIIRETSVATFNDVYNLSFGAKVGTNLPAGQYVNSVIISAVANPIRVTSLNQLTYMQDMNSDICTNTTENVTKQLIDMRDGKSYWVAKLKDGNCWMTQNLALDLSTNKTLTTADTDIMEDWTPDSSMNEIALDGEPLSMDRGRSYSWSFGKVVLATPLLSKRCERVPQSDGSALSAENLGDVCRSSGFIDVSNSQWQSIFTAQEGVFNGEKQPLVAADEANYTYDSHYLIGNYYSWNAATAQSGLGITEANQNASESICPKAWRLPTNGKNENNQPITNPYIKTGSFYQLLRAYGYPETGGYEINTEYNRPYFTSENVATLRKAPLYIVDAGNIYATVFGNLRNLGSTSYLWSSAFSGLEHRTFAFNISSRENSVYPATDMDDINAISIRCLAR